MTGWRGGFAGAHARTIGDVSAMQVFVHSVLSNDPTGEQAAESPELPLLAERALLLARRHDVVCVPAPVEEAYLAYLAALGLGPAPERVVVVAGGASALGPNLSTALAGDAEALDRIGGLVGGSASVALHPYMVWAPELRLADRLAARLGRRPALAGGPWRAAAAANRKYVVRARAVELGVPLARGEVVELRIRPEGRPLGLEPLRAAVLRRLPATGRVIVRGAVGGGGSAVFVANDPDGGLDAVLAAVAARRLNRVYLVEELLEAVVSPNLESRIGPEGIACFGATDQRWSGPLRHGGNVYPASAGRLGGMIRHGIRLCGWLRGLGYAGVAGLDFFEAADPRTGEPTPYLAEINARMNAATFALALADRLDRANVARGRPRVGAFATGTIESGAGTFAEFRRRYGPALYDADRGEGIFPVAAGSLRVGRLGVVAAATTRAGALDLLERFRARVRWAEAGPEAGVRAGAAAPGAVS